MKTKKMLSMLLALCLLAGLLPLAATPAAAVNEHEIHISSNGNYGTVVVESPRVRLVDGKVYDQTGVLVTLRYEPNDGCVMEAAVFGERFDGGLLGPWTEWDYDHPISTNNAAYGQFVMPDHDVYIRVDFVPTSGVYYLYISDRIEHGTVTTVGNRNQYAQGELVELNVTPDRGYAVRDVLYGPGQNPSIWMRLAGNRRSFEMPGYDATVRATFDALPAYEISASVSADGGGTVSGGGTWYQGETVTLTAVPAAGYAFANWTENGTVVSSDPAYSFVANGYRTLTANFRDPTKAYISVSAATDGGTVAGGGIYAPGASVTLTATPAAGYAFLGWTENGAVVSADEVYTFTAEAGYRALTAGFVRSYTVAASAAPAAYGSVTGAGSYHEGETVTLTAVPAANGVFLYWEENNAVVSSDEVYTFITARDRTLTARFKQAGTYTISATVPTGGTVTGAGSYHEGDTVTLRATPTPGSNYYFAYWGEGSAAVSGDAEYSFPADRDRLTLTAHFIQCTEWTDATALPSQPGSYVLMTDVNDPGSPVTPQGTTSLLLNGHNISTRNDQYQITDGSVLNIYGSGNLPSIFLQATGGTFNMYGGTIANKSSYGVSLYGSGCTFNLYGGAITGNNGSAVYVGTGSEGATFNMYGGMLTGNSARNKAYGAAICVYKGNAYIHGGTITGNAGYNGAAGGIRIRSFRYYPAVFRMDGGTISDIDGPTFTQEGDFNTIELVGGEILCALRLNDGVSDASERVDVRYRGPLPPVAVPERAHYSFGGYYTGQNGGGTQVYNASGNSVIAQWNDWNGANLYAKWTPDAYRLTYDLNGGTLGFTDTDYSIESTDALPTPAKEHADFAGWRVSAAGGSWTENAVFAAGTALTGRYGNATLTAQWATHSYTVTWRNWDDYVLSEDTVPYGTVPAYIGNAPTRPLDAEHSYVFSGWDHEPAAVAGDTAYRAVYTAGPRAYTIRFLDDDGTVLQSGEVDYGVTPAYAGEAPVKAADAQYSYAFACWAPEPVPVTGDADYKATYTALRNSYEIRFVAEDGTVLQSGMVPYGDTPEYTGETPEKAATAQYTYAFAGWTPEIVPVTGAAVYTATYTQTAKPQPVYYDWTPPAPAETRFELVDTSKGGTVDNFKAIRTYTDGMFGDVDAKGWYAENIAAAVRFGIFEGMGDGSFGIGRPLKVSEALAVACRLHNLFYGGSGAFDQTKDEHWYDVYADYAAKYGILAHGALDLTKDITRAQFALLVAAALPESALNAVTDRLPPDVDPNDPAYPAIALLYAAGVVNGVDEEGSFAPDALISREQIAAIVTRVADPALRKSVTI